MSDEVALLIADLYEAVGVLRRWGEAVASEEGQTQSRWQVLSVVSDPPLTVPSAARRLGISRQAVQRTVNELVDDGLVRVASNPDHRTSGLVELTERGREVLQRMNGRAEQVHQQVLAAIPAGELAGGRALLRRLVTSVQDIERHSA